MEPGSGTPAYRERCRLMAISKRLRYRAGLSLADLVYSVKVAADAYGITSSRFRYFCGVAWKRVNATQELAKVIYDEAQRQAAS